MTQENMTCKIEDLKNYGKPMSVTIRTIPPPFASIQAPFPVLTLATIRVSDKKTFTKKSFNYI